MKLKRSNLSYAVTNVITELARSKRSTPRLLTTHHRGHFPATSFTLEYRIKHVARLMDESVIFARHARPESNKTATSHASVSDCAPVLLPEPTAPTDQDYTPQSD